MASRLIEKARYIGNSAQIENSEGSKITKFSNSQVGLSWIKRDRFGLSRLFVAREMQHRNACGTHSIVTGALARRRTKRLGTERVLIRPMPAAAVKLCRHRNDTN